MSENTTPNKRGRKPATVTETTETLDVVETVEDNATKKKVTKEYSAETPILCRSIASGTLLMEGIRTGMLYRWVAYGDEVEVEYQDIIASIRSSASYVMKPYFIIEDEELVNQYPQLRNIYESMYSISDLYDILDMDAEEMRSVVMTLPEGAKESLQNIASSQIANGAMDSVRKIKVLDEVFNTKMVMLTELFGE